MKMKLINDGYSIKMYNYSIILLFLIFSNISFTMFVTALTSRPIIILTQVLMIIFFVLIFVVVFKKIKRKAKISQARLEFEKKLFEINYAEEDYKKKILVQILIKMLLGVLILTGLFFILKTAISIVSLIIILGILLLIYFVFELIVLNDIYRKNIYLRITDAGVIFNDEKIPWSEITCYNLVDGYLYLSDISRIHHHFFEYNICITIKNKEDGKRIEKIFDKFLPNKRNRTLKITNNVGFY